VKGAILFYGKNTKFFNLPPMIKFGNLEFKFGIRSPKLASVGEGLKPGMALRIAPIEVPKIAYKDVEMEVTLYDEKLPSQMRVFLGGFRLLSR